MWRQTESILNKLTLFYFSEQSYIANKLSFDLRKTTRYEVGTYIFSVKFAINQTILIAIFETDVFVHRHLSRSSMDGGGNVSRAI